MQFISEMREPRPASRDECLPLSGRRARHSGKSPSGFIHDQLDSMPNRLMRNQNVSEPYVGWLALDLSQTGIGKRNAV
jgi:hypothetical protein